MVMHSEIYVNGDSFSEGAVYLDSPSECWPYKLLENGFTVTNDSLGGGSNYRIVRKSTQALTENPYNKYCAVFAWTDWTRYEIPSNKGYERQYHSTADEAALVENFVDQIQTMEAMCRALHITCWHMNCFSSHYNIEYADKITEERVIRKLNSLDMRHWIIPATSSIVDWARNRDLNFTDCGHLTAESNAVLAEHIRQRIFND